MFGFDSLFYKFGSVIADIFMVSILWIVFSLPIITIGSSTTAAYYVMTKRATGSDSYLVRDFIKSFKENWKPTTIMTVILIAIAGLLYINIRQLPGVELGFLRWPVQIALTLTTIQVIFVSLYVFPLYARFELGIMESFRTSLQIANKHLLVSISNIMLMFAIVFVAGYMPFLLVFTIGMYVYFSSFGFIRIFRKNGAEI